MEETYCVITFPNSHTAMAAQKLLAECQIPIFMMPTLRELSDSCGLSIRFNPADSRHVRFALAEDALLRDRHQIYLVSHDANGCRIIEKA